MRSGSAAIAPESSLVGVARLVVIERPDARLPAWVQRRRARSGLSLVRHASLPPAATVWCPGAAESWEHVVADVADTTASGGAVLLNLPSTRRPAVPRVIAAIQAAPDDLGVCLEAARCARALPGDLVLLHCVPMSFAERSVGLDAAVARGHTVLRDCRRGLAEHLAEDDPEQGGSVRASTRLVRAYPHELVSDDLDADLIVVGGSRIGAEGGLGLVALSVARHAPCPVLVVPRPPRPRSASGSAPGS
jgi:nucleotide-binding universal stress UspA family protein